MAPPFREASMSLTLPLTILGAILTWTLVEYVIHRWLGHDRRFTQRSAFGAEHVAHHADGDHFAPTWKKVVFLGLATAFVGAPAALVGGGLGLVFAVAFLAAWLVYEVIHRRMHTSAGAGPYARWIRRHHFLHHFHDPRRNFGVSSPLWDLVFRTRLPPASTGRIIVPRRQAMRWLLDTNGAVRSRHAHDYALKVRPGNSQYY